MSTTPNQLTKPIWTGLLRRDSSGTDLEGGSRPYGQEAGGARILVMDDRQPVTWLEIPERHSPEDLLKRANELAPALQRHPIVQGGPSTTVAIATHERGPRLDRCLQAMTQALVMEPDVEVLVIDNAPKTSATQDVVTSWAERGLNVRREVLAQAGTSRARNYALKLATTEIVAYIDDDVLVDRNWVASIRSAFVSFPEATIATGMVAPAELDTAPQQIFERKMRWSTLRKRECFSMDKRELYDFPFPYMAGNFGSAANMALRRERALELGGFNDVLGPGNRTRGGEDFELFVRFIRRGESLAFEPTALGWHLHRRTEAELRSQLFGYGVGMTSYLATIAGEPGRRELAREVIKAATTLISSRSKESQEGFPAIYSFLEFGGMAWGIGAYPRARLDHRHDASLAASQ